MCALPTTGADFLALAPSLACWHRLTALMASVPSASTECGEAGDRQIRGCSRNCKRRIFRHHATGLSGPGKAAEGSDPRARRPAVSRGHTRACRPGGADRAEPARTVVLVRLRSQVTCHNVAPEVSYYIRIAPALLVPFTETKLKGSIGTGFKAPTLSQLFADFRGSASARSGTGHRKAAARPGRVLRGAKPADLPVEQSTKVEFVVNLRTARALRMNIPLPLIGRADEVIE